MADSFFTEKIISWYLQNKRTLPWRETKDPYKIWLSEVILQQTRVKQGLPYYNRFVENYPQVRDLAAAELQEVLRLWQGLGYYSRAENMHQTAKFIVENLDAKFPETFTALLQLKGVGKYTAAAIASFAYNETVAVLDGNVYRVLARYYGIEADIASTEGTKAFYLLAQELVPEGRADVYNQAIMEFGAMQCSPQKPNCMYCPLQEKCSAFHSGKQDQLPVKVKKIKQKERFFYYLLCYSAEKILMKLRQGKGIWKGLYEFMLVERQQELATAHIPQEILPKELKSLVKLNRISESHKHILTHQILKVVFIHLEVLDEQRFEESFPTGGRFYSIEEIKTLPKPILIHQYLEKHIY